VEEDADEDDADEDDDGHFLILMEALRVCCLSSFLLSFFLYCCSILLFNPAAPPELTDKESAQVFLILEIAQSGQPFVQILVLVYIGRDVAMI
jgi:hypothetical protein